MEQIILEAVKRNLKLILKGIEEPQTFWIELIDLNNNVITTESPKVQDMHEAVTLLEEFSWETYETEIVHPLYTDEIQIARRKSLTPQERIIELYDLFLQGSEPSMNSMMARYKVSDDTISKDLKRLRAVFNERNKSIDYDSKDNVYRLNPLDGNLLNKTEIIAMLLIIYSSRAFNEDELQQITEKLIQNVSKESQRQIKQFMNTYDVHYEPIQLEDTLEMIRNCLQAIQYKKLVSFDYHSRQSKLREVIPYSLAIHKGIFYLLAFKEGDYRKLISWRFDRMTDLKILDKRAKYEGHYLEVGAYLKKSVWMFSGDSVTVQLNIREVLLEYLCREFPHVSYKPTVDGWMKVEVMVNGLDAIAFWVLQQAENVEVLSPSNFRQLIIEKINKMSEIYKSNKPLA